MKRIFIFLGLLLYVCPFIYGQDLVYKPINPAFGGDTFNYNWLLSSAQAQNTHEGKTVISPTEDSKTMLENFKNNLNRQILGQLSTYILQNQFGEDGFKKGKYKLGIYEITVDNSSEGLKVDIVDTGTGAQTQIIVPYL